MNVWNAMKNIRFIFQWNQAHLFHPLLQWNKDCLVNKTDLQRGGFVVFFVLVVFSPKVENNVTDEDDITDRRKTLLQQMANFPPWNIRFHIFINFYYCCFHSERFGTEMLEAGHLTFCNVS